MRTPADPAPERSSPSPFRATWFLRTFGLTKVPLIWYVRPRVLELSDERIEVVIPLRWRTKNHLGAMYFGALAVGADIAGGLMAVRLIDESGVKISFVFKDLRAEFLKRAEGDVHFVSNSGKLARELVARAISSGERCNESIAVTATVPTKLGDEPVAKFILTLSIKRSK